MIDPSKRESPAQGAQAAAGIPVRRLLDQAETFGLRLQAGADGLDRTIEDAEVQKPGLVLAGMQPAHPRAVHVLGSGEIDYLSVRGPQTQAAMLQEYVRAGVPCVVISRGHAPSETMLEVAENQGIPLFTTLQPTGRFMRLLHAWLQDELAPRWEVHGVLVQIHSVGVLITGASGIGKSETALEIILRGHRLVADDVVSLVRSGDVLVGTGRAPLGHYMEIRGLGVLHAGDLFGQASVVDHGPVDLVVELVDWQESPLLDRTGLDERFVRYLDVELPMLVLPVRPGRNMATIVEVAARNHILKSRGLYSARRYEADLLDRLGSTDDEG